MLHGINVRFTEIEEQLRELKVDQLLPSIIATIMRMRQRLDSLLDGDLILSPADYYELIDDMEYFTLDLKTLQIPRSLLSIRSTPRKRQTVNAFLADRSKAINQFLHTLALEVADETRPTVPPAQGPGPHFNIENGQIGFAARNEFDPNKNNVRRLESILPLLQAETANALAAFGKNMAHPKVHDALLNYQAALDGTVDTLNYDLIAAYGLWLANAEAAAQREIDDRLSPQFEDDHLASLKTVLDLHGPFILSTDAGRSLIDDAISFYKTGEQEREFKESATELASAIADEGIAKPAAGEFLIEAATNIAVGPQPDRSAKVGGNAVRNAVTAIIGGALVSYPLAVGLAGPMAAWLAVIIAGEAVKKSNVGKAAVEVIKDAVDDPSQRRNFAKLGEFALKHEALLRRLASDRREFSWVHNWLTWIKEQAPKRSDQEK
ncbi:hypothetical protein F4V91_13595 [Neorhizobium galegae]|uniref:Uncharacterized protein n=1 Tax=Neorhizobium galegae TaxID=399 RepID=A0A6A1TSZ0_NEOGA|nr:hypothetical protein [Neorhizobium galegae]KAB1087366.1 hypothetical protein F4V91_13595 [Neorhizobium galegae]